MGLLGISIFIFREKLPKGHLDLVMWHATNHSIGYKGRLRSSLVSSGENEKSQLCVEAALILRKHTVIQ
jgi:hypothetical protein